MNAQLNDPHDNSSFTLNINPTTFARGSQIVIIGASYARGWNLTDINGISFINKGIDGQQSFEMLERFQNDVIDSQPQAVIIWGFINDIFRGDKSGIEDVIKRTRDSMIKMVSLAHNNNIVPVLMTEVTIRHEDSLVSNVMAFIGRILGRESYQDYVNSRVTQVNSWLRDWALNDNLALLDIQPMLSNVDGKRKKEYAKPDGSHITPEGYQRLSDYLANVISQNRDN